MKTLLAVACLVMSAAIAPAAQIGPVQLVVTPSWLQQHVADPNVVLLHVGAKATYDAGHIPGARFVDFSVIARTGTEGLTLEMLPDETLRERLAGLGISNDTHVVVYQSDNQWTQSTRVMLTLDYAGLAKVSWLDGGQKAWTAAGGTVTADLPAITPGNLSPLKTRPVVADAEFVKAHLGASGYTVIDSRAPAFYDGTRTGGRAGAEHKTGHIAGAVNIPFDTFTTPDVTLKPAAEIAAAFSKAGVKPGDTVITYCHIGQQATATLFAARTLGYKVMLYDGSFEDWSKRDLPVEVKKEK